MNLDNIVEKYVTMSEFSGRDLYEGWRVNEAGREGRLSNKRFLTSAFKASSEKIIKDAIKTFNPKKHYNTDSDPSNYVGRKLATLMLLDKWDLYKDQKNPDNIDPELRKILEKLIKKYKLIELDVWDGIADMFYFN